MGREPAPGCSSRLRERSDTSVGERGARGVVKGFTQGNAGTPSRTSAAPLHCSIKLRAIAPEEQPRIQRCNPTRQVRRCQLAVTQRQHVKRWVVVHALQHWSQGSEQRPCSGLIPNLGRGDQVLCMTRQCCARNLSSGCFAPLFAAAPFLPPLDHTHGGQCGHRRHENTSQGELAWRCRQHGSRSWIPAKDPLNPRPQSRSAHRHFP